MMNQDKRTIMIGGILLVAAWAVWCFFFLNRGIDFTDEGLYVSEAWRFAMGDLPFRDSMGAWGLPFWWLSFIFHVYPECGMLGLRIVWAVYILLCAFVAAKLMLRYFNPWISFAGPAIAVAFPSHAPIKVLDYNMLCALPLLLVVWMWMSACRRTGRMQIILAACAGLMAFLATTCRTSIFPIVFLPVLSVIYDRLCGIKMDGWLRAVLAFLSAYFVGMVCLILILNTTGLMDSFLGTFRVGLGWQGYSPKEIFDHLIYSGCFYLLPALPVIGIALLAWQFKAITRLAREHKRIILYTLFAILVVCSAGTILNWAFLSDTINRLMAYAHRMILGPFRPHPWLNYIFLSVAIGVVLADVIINVIKSHHKNSSASVQDRCRLCILAIFLPLLMIPGTGNVPAANVNGMSWLLISMAVGLLWLWIPRPSEHKIRVSQVRLLRAALIVGLLLVGSYRVSTNLYPYGNGAIWNLVAMPSSVKLQGIYTTRERASVIDRLVEAVKLNSQPGDRILAYENLPMIYYLTDRLPATATWVSEVFPRPIRESLLEDMINHGRIPKLVVRATYATASETWPTSKSPLLWNSGEQELDPIDEYVKENYRVIQDIDGFEIMAPIE